MEEFTEKFEEWFQEWSDDWSEHWYLRVIAAGIFVVIALSAHLKDRLLSTSTLPRFSDSLLERLSIQAWCYRLLWIEAFFSVLVFVFMPVEGFGFFAVCGVLALATGTTYDTLHYFHRDEHILSPLLLLCAAKFKTLRTTENIESIRKKWEAIRNKPKDPKDPQVPPLQTKIMRDRSVLGRMLYKLRHFFLVLPPLNMNIDQVEAFGDILLWDEITKPPFIKKDRKVTIGGLLRHIRWQRGIGRWPWQWQCDGTAPLRWTQGGEAVSAFTTVKRAISHVHKCGEGSKKFLVTMDYAARIDFPDLLGSMIAKKAGSPGLGPSQGKRNHEAWRMMGIEIIATLHQCLGIEKVSIPHTVKGANRMYSMLEDFDAIHFARQAVDYVAERVAKQAALEAVDEKEEKIKKQLNQWLHRREVTHMSPETYTAIHWITFGLMIQWGARRTTRTGKILFDSITKKMNDCTSCMSYYDTYTLKKSGKGNETGDACTSIIWYLSEEDWPSEQLEEAITQWAVTLMRDHGYYVLVEKEKKLREKKD